MNGKQIKISLDNLNLPVSMYIHSISRGVTMKAFKLDVEKVITITATYFVEAESEDDALQVIEDKQQRGDIEPNNIGKDSSIYDDRLGDDRGTWEVQEETTVEEITELKLEKEVA